jgi:hypothetical protein
MGIPLDALVTPALCKTCVFYSPALKTCKTSIVAVSKTRKFYDFAKSVRLDPERCGPDAKFFIKRPELAISLRDWEP